MLILPLSITALIYGALYQAYPQFLFSLIEPAFLGTGSPMQGMVVETMVFIGFAAACTYALFQAFGFLRRTASMMRNEGRWLMRFGVVLLLIWRFGFLILGKVLYGAAGVDSSALSDVMVAIHSAPVFWVAMSLIAAGILRATLGQMGRAKAAIDG